MITPVPSSLGALASEICELKRVRSPRGQRSLADERFLRAWAALASGAELEDVAAMELAFAAAHVALGPVDATALANAGVPATDRAVVYERAAERALGRIDDRLRTSLARLAAGERPVPPAPRFAERLSQSPLAGASNGPRMVMTPADLHGEHSWSVAVIGATIQYARHAALGPVVLLGLVHHAHNATLPDGGPAADTVLSERLPAMRATATARALTELPSALWQMCRDALDEQDNLQTGLGTAFAAAHVIDTVLQQRHYANLAGFSLSDALQETDLVAPGARGAFERDVLNRLNLAF